MLLLLNHALSAPCAAFPAHSDHDAADYFIRRHGDPNADQTEAAHDAKEVSAYHRATPHGGNAKKSGKFYVSGGFQTVDNDKVAGSAEFKEDADKQHPSPERDDWRPDSRDLRVGGKQLRMVLLTRL